MKNLIVYKSCTGFTKRYAEMIGQKTGSIVMELKEVSSASMSRYDRIVYGGGFYAGSLNGLKKAKSMFVGSRAKELIIFGVGAMPENSPMVSDMWKRNLQEEAETIPHYYMVGGLDYDHMKLIHKIMMKGAITGVKNSKNRDENMETFLKITGSSFDGVDIRYAKALITKLEADK